MTLGAQINQFQSYFCRLLSNCSFLMCKLCWEGMCLDVSRPDSGCPSLLFWCICTVSQTGHCIMENGFWCHSHLECDIILSRRVDARGYEQKENTHVLTYAAQIHQHGGTAINAGLYHVCSVLLDSIIYTTAWLLNTQWQPHRPARTRSGRGMQLETALMSIGLRLWKSQWGPGSKNVTVTKMLKTIMSNVLHWIPNSRSWSFNKQTWQCAKFQIGLESKFCLLGFSDVDLQDLNTCTSKMLWGKKTKEWDLGLDLKRRKNKSKNNKL